MKSLDDFESQLEQQLDGLYGAALRYTRNSSQAEDLVQETVVRALRFRHQFAPGTNFRGWIFTILTRTFIEGYRRRKREREILEGSAGEVHDQLHSVQAQATANAPEAAYLNRMVSGSVLAALDELPEEYRVVVVLCDMQGLGYREIAEAVGCPVGTVMSRLYRGRRLLEGKLAKVAQEHGVLKAPADEIDTSSGEVFHLAAFRRRKQG